MAQTRPAYPTALEGAPLTAWLSRETDIAPAQVVAISPSAISAVVSVFPNESGARVVVRSEAVTPDAQVRNGAMSWQVSVFADCKSGQVRLGETSGYPERNLIGAAKSIRPPELTPRAPQPGTPLESIFRVACDPTFKRPLEGVARTAAAPPAPARAAAAPPPKAAPSKPPPAASTASASASGAVVQISATDNEAAAAADLLDVQRRFPAAVDGRATRVERAQVNGRTVYRATFTGFAGPSEAQAACDRLKAGGQGCFVRAR